MNLFNHIQGLKGETLTSSLMKYLLVTSQEVRTTFMEYLSDKSPIGPIISFSRFCCETEYVTKNDTHNGSLDLLIECDNAIIGIENKLNAEFQPDQPGKYLDTLLNISKSENRLRNNVDPVLFILCPENRIPDSEVAISKINSHEVKVKTITWEELLDNLHKIIIKTDSRTKVILADFIKYIENEISFYPEYRNIFPHLLSRFSPNGTPEQKSILIELWKYFPNAGKKLSFGESYSGYYFEPLFDSDNNGENNHIGWYGFVDSNVVEPLNDNIVSFIVMSTYKPADLSKKFIPTELLKSGWSLGRSENSVTTWRLDLDIDWDKPEKWRRIFGSFHK